jgi:hypothetical protein
MVKPTPTARESDRPWVNTVLFSEKKFKKA